MTLPEKLAREISRVTDLRAQYRSLRGMPGVNVDFAIRLMTESLDRAFAAAGSPDIEAQIAAVRDLEGFTE